MVGGAEGRGDGLSLFAFLGEREAVSIGLVVHEDPDVGVVPNVAKPMIGPAPVPIVKLGHAPPLTEAGLTESVPLRDASDPIPANGEAWGEVGLAPSSHPVGVDPRVWAAVLPKAEDWQRDITARVAEVGVAHPVAADPIRACV